MNINIISQEIEKFKILKNKNYESFINNQFETIIFSNCLEFLKENFSGTWNIAQSVKYL